METMQTCQLCTNGCNPSRVFLPLEHGTTVDGGNGNKPVNKASVLVINYGMKNSQLQLKILHTIHWIYTGVS